MSAAAPALYAPSPPVGAATGTLPRAWPLYAVLLSYPVWWALGAAYFIWPLLTAPLAIALLIRRDIKVPPRFGLWLLFLAWMLLSGTQLTEMSFAFVWRALIYLSATVLFLYVFNASRARIPDRTVVIVLALFFAEVIIAGAVGVAFPTVTFDTPLGKLLPSALLGDELVQATVHPGLSDVMVILGYPVGRPKALFAYTNQWGACAALLVPFAIAAFGYVRRPSNRVALGACVLLAVVPLIVSLNRGVWLSLGIALAYTALRFARLKNGKALVGGVALLVTVAAIVYATPLSTLAHDRVSTESASTNTRLSLYAGLREQVRDAPLLGVGSPSVRTEEGTAPPVGTQGQLSLLAYSHGIPGLLLFLAWFGHAAFRSGRRAVRTHFSGHLAILVAILLMPFYSLLPVALHVVMIAAALVWRDVARPEPRAQGLRPSSAAG